MTWTRHENGAGATPTFGRRRRCTALTKTASVDIALWLIAFLLMLLRLSSAPPLTAMPSMYRAVWLSVKRRDGRRDTQIVYSAKTMKHHHRRRNKFEKWGRGGGTRSALKICRAPLLVLALKVQLVVMVSAFVMVSTVWSVYCLLFFYSWSPRAQPFLKVGGTCPPCPMESTQLCTTLADWAFSQRRLYDERAAVLVIYTNALV